MQKQIEQYIENIKKDYVGWGNPKTDTERTVRDNMVKEFCESISVKPGKKYIKVMTKIGTSNSVHSFIASKAVSYTHLPSPRDRTRSRMPSSA